MTGMRPVVDIMFGDFLTLVMDQLANQAAKTHYMSGGKLTVPLVLRTTLGATRRSAAQHSQSLHAWVAHVPGLKVVPALDALRRQGPAQDGDPRRQPGRLLRGQDGLRASRATCPTASTRSRSASPTSSARATDVTLVATSSMVRVALDAAELLEADGISAEVVDPRTLVAARPRRARPLGAEDRPRDRRRRGAPQLRRHARSSPRSSPRARSGTSTRRCGGSRAMDVPIPFSPPLEDVTVPTPETRRAGRARALRPQLERGERWRLRTYGTMAVDWEQRADFDRLRTERLARAKARSRALRARGAALLRHERTSATSPRPTSARGRWTSYVRFCLLPRGDEPIMWDFGSAARHHKLYSPWLGEERSRAGISTLRGSAPGGAPRPSRRRSAIELEERGLLGEPLGVDIVELPVLFALAGGGDQGRRRPGADAGRPHDQDRGRDHAAEHRLRHGRRRLRRAVIAR